MSISVLGAGAFGTALAISLCGNGPVCLWARDPGDMQTARVNSARLPGRPFPPALRVTGDLPEATQASVILMAVPMQRLREVLRAHSGLLSGKQLVACCKGMEVDTGLGPVSIITEEVPDATAAIMTGPSFADDIARGLPTALTLGCANNGAARNLQKALTTNNLRLYRTNDTIGAELGGALKNVIAIACGAAMGSGLGESARAALLTRGFAEMQRLARHLEALPDTLSGLSGFGDLVLTCTSEQSRNYRLGQSIGQGHAFDQTITVEGAATARAVHALALKARLDLPIAAVVAGLIENRQDVSSAMTSLLARPLKEE